MKIIEEKWVIMDKNRKVIAKGSPRNRHLVFLDDKKDKKRFLTYTSEAIARVAYENSGFYFKTGTSYFENTYGIEVNSYESIKPYLEPVKMTITMELE